MALRGDELFLSYGVMGGFMQVRRTINIFGYPPIFHISHKVTSKSSSTSFVVLQPKLPWTRPVSAFLQALQMTMIKITNLM